MVQLVFLLQPPQDRDRVLDRRLADEDRLEAPRQGRILLDMLAILVERRRPDAVQFAAGQGGLQQVRGIHRALALAGADERVHLVDEQDDAAGRGRHLVQHGLQPLLELPAVFRAGDERAHVERQQLLVFEALGHVAVDDAQRQTFDDRGLADAGFADQHGVVLGAARQHLDRAADLLVPADHGIELAGARRLRQVAGIFFQRVVAVLGRGGIGLAALAQILDGAVQHLRVDARCVEDTAGLRALVHRKGEQKPLDRDETVAGLLGDLLGLVEQARGAGREVELARAASRYFRHLGERRLRGLQRVARTPAGPVDQARREPLAVVEQNLEDVFRRELLVAFTQGQRLGGLHETARPLGEFFEIHRSSLHGVPAPKRRGSTDKVRPRMATG